MIDVHYWPTPNGFKITIMLEECGLPYRGATRIWLRAYESTP